jgi:hypothetical protein
MSDYETGLHRQQDLYLSEVLELMVAREYMRRYRAILARRVTWFGSLRAVASSSAIAAWAVWQSYPMIWGGIIALSQVADVLKDVFPFAARDKAANNLTSSLEVLLIEVLYEAEGVYAGRFTNEEITDRRRKLMNARHDAEVKHFPTGNLPERKDILMLANDAAIAYFEATFGPRSNP